MAASIVLASASAARTKMLLDAGVDHICDPANIDESALQNDKALGSTLAPEDIALRLAIAKAQDVAKRHVDHWVVGCDQVLAFNGQLLTKPGTPGGVARQLTMLRGQKHSLVSAVAVVKNSDVVWSHHDRAELHMREFSEAFLQDYVARVGKDVANSVGGYHLEGLGAQLFEAVDGDHFTVLGLPLIAVLSFLRSQGVVQV